MFYFSTSFTVNLSGCKDLYVGTKVEHPDPVSVYRNGVSLKGTIDKERN
jgi:hypothetical protein